MLRFFSRRKVKGRADQKVGSAGGRRLAGKYNKNILNCNIMLLDGSDLAIEIGVSFSLYNLILKCQQTCRYLLDF